MPNALILLLFNGIVTTLNVNAIISGVADTIIYIENSSAMNEIGTKYIDQELTACQEFVPKSDGYWRCMIQQLSKTGNHPSCTCRMGDPSDPTSVVDPQLRYVIYTYSKFESIPNAISKWV